MPPAQASMHELMRRARVLSSGALAANAARIDTDAEFPSENIRALHDAGLMAVFLSPDFGGHEASVRTYCEIAAILAEGCASTGMIWAMHGQQLISLLDHAQQSHRDQLALVGKRGCVIGSVTTDAVGGADLTSTGPALVTEGERLRLQRDAPVVTAGSCAGMYLVTMRADPDSPPNRTRLVCVMPDDGVVEECGTWDALGMRGTRSRAMRFDVLVHPRAVLAAPFAEVARWTMIPVGHVGWASCWLGVARAATAQIRDAIRARELGRGSTSSDLLFARLADIQLSLDLLESIVLRVAMEIDRVRGDRRAGSIAEPLNPVIVNNVKLAGSRLAFGVVDQLIDIAGMRDGYRRDGRFGLERAFRDLRSASLMFHDDRLLQANGRLVLASGSGLAGLADPPLEASSRNGVGAPQ